MKTKAVTTPTEKLMFEVLMVALTLVCAMVLTDAVLILAYG